MKRWMLHLALAGALAVPGAVLAQGTEAWPARPIRWIVPYTPGAGSDAVARMLSDKLAAELGQNVVVENRGGAAGMIGTDLGAKSAPDGYTWIMGSDAAFTIAPNLGKAPYDPLKDFAPVCVLDTVPMMLVAGAGFAHATVADLVAAAKRSPGKLTAASSGNGSSAHLAAEYFKNVAGIDLLHVPYKGRAEALTDVMAGRVDVNFSAVGGTLNNVRAGRLKVIAIASRDRVAALPGVPTIAESGYPGFHIAVWHGLLMPAGTPPAIVTRANQAVNRVLQLPDILERLGGLTFIPGGGRPQDLADLIAAEHAQWKRLIQGARIRSD